MKVNGHNENMFFQLFSLRYMLCVCLKLHASEEGDMIPSISKIIIQIRRT